jgi:adenylate cyclase
MKSTQFSLKSLLLGNVIVIVVIMLFMSLFSDVVDIFESKTVDSRFRFRDMLGKNPEYSDAIFHVNIDNYSKKESGMALWPKEYYASLISKTAESEAEIIAMDIMFVESLDTVGNKAVGNSIMEAGNVITPYMVQFGSSEEHFSWEGMENYQDAFYFDVNPAAMSGSAHHVTELLFVPLIDIVEYSAEMGFVNIEPDIDGVVRRLPVVAEVDGRLALSFFFQALCSFLDYDIENIEVISKSQLVLSQFPSIITGEKKVIKIPLDGHGNLLVNFAGPLGIDVYPQAISAWDLLKSERSSDVSGKLVIFSDISTQAGDYSPIPLENLFPRSYLISNAVNTILSEQFIRDTPGMISSLIIGLFVIVIILMCIKFDTFKFNIGSLCVTVLYVVGVFIFFLVCGLILPLIPVIAPLGGVYLFSSVFKHSHTERHRGILEGSLRSYLSPILMAKVEENPDLLKIGGERKRISVLFSDVVGFTSFCDQADPAEVQEVLERYFKESARIIFSTDGIIDKYLGDGILAFFENPDETITSAERAIQCAIEMQKSAVELDKHYKSQNRFPFAIRVGVSTGYAKVGNIGPVEKVDYTIIGSVVNLSSRLQSFGEPGDIIIDKDTMFFIKDEYEIVALGEQSLKGFANTVKVYKVKCS